MTEPMPHQNGVVPISSGRMVRFATNVPTEIALQCVDGVRIEGRYGDRVKYTLTDDRTMHVPPFVADRIRQLEIQPGEVFQVCKLQAKKGNRKTIHWAVERGDAENQLERDLRDSLARIDNPDITSPPSPAVVIARETHMPPAIPFHELEPAAPDGNGYNGHNGASGADRIAAPSPPSTDDTARKPPDTQLAHALKTAVAAAADAERFAKTLDYNIRFTTEDVRSMGITVLIGMQQRPR